MAQLIVECHDGMYQITSQDFCIHVANTKKNTRVVWLLLRALHDPDTGANLFPPEQIAKAFGYKARQNIQNFEQDFQKCGQDILAYLQQKCKGDASVVEAVGVVLRQPPLAPATKLCPLVQSRLNRPDITPGNIRTALQTVPCSVIRPVLQRHWEQGTFHPTEQQLLEQALALLLETSPASSPVSETLSRLGVSPAEDDEEVDVQQQQTDAAPFLLRAHASNPQIPTKIRLMGVAFTLYYWNVPLSRLALWMGGIPSTVLNWVTGLAVVLYPPIHGWMVSHVRAISLAVDEKWLRLHHVWHYWFVAVDEATGLPVAMALLSSRTTWACWWFLLRVKHLGVRPLAIITDGLAGYASRIPVIVPSAKHLLCLFHAQQGVTRWLRDHAASLSKEVAVSLKHAMKRVLQTTNPRTVRRRLARLASLDGAQACGLETWSAQTAKKLDRLDPALRDNAYPRTTNGLERCFRAFHRFYKTRGGFHSVKSANRQLMLFIVGYVFTIQPGTGRAPIEQIVPQASQMPFSQILNAPFRCGLVHICQSKNGAWENMATQPAPLAAGLPS